MSKAQESEYLESLHTFYSERLKAGFKKKSKTCKGCDNKKQFITRKGKLYYTCGSSSGKCGLQFEIDLAQYVHYPETLRDNLSVQSMLNKSKHPDIFTSDEIKEYEELIQMSNDILNTATKEYTKLNNLTKRQTLIQETHKQRMNQKKEQNLLMKQISEETDTLKKKSLMQNYILLNQTIFEKYKSLDDECSSLVNHLVVEPGKVNHESDTFEQVLEKPKQKLGNPLNKNLIPQLQGFDKLPMNDLIMNVIVAYRDPGDGSRREQLKKFKGQMNLVFQDQTNIRIFIVEQEGDRPDYGSLPELIQQPNSHMAKFNLGILKNIGFSLAKQSMKGNKKAYYILSDVDLLPSQGLIQDYLRYPENPIHLANKGTRYNMDGRDRNFLGGVLSITDKDFERANGYPNNFWGWGGEDNALNYRLRANKIQVEKPNEPVIDLEELSLDDKLAKLKQDQTKEMRKREKLTEDKTTWKQNGLSDLEEHYTIKKKYKIKPNITHVKVVLKVD